VRERIWITNATANPRNPSGTETKAPMVWARKSDAVSPIPVVRILMIQKYAVISGTLLSG
jgi:hypothetical protein